MLKKEMQLKATMRKAMGEMLKAQKEYADMQFKKWGVNKKTHKLSMTKILYDRKIERDHFTIGYKKKPNGEWFMVKIIL